MRAQDKFGKIYTPEKFAEMLKPNKYLPQS